MDLVIQVVLLLVIVSYLMNVLFNATESTDTLISSDCSNDDIMS
jgi:hypothetical protein